MDHGVKVPKELFGWLAGWKEQCDSLIETEISGIIAGIEIARKLKIQDTDILSDSVEAT